MKNQETAFVCDLTVLGQEEREQFASVTDALFNAVQETRELENGFVFRFTNQPGQLIQIAEFIEREGQCCPFLNFALEVEPSSGPAWLYISGDTGTKEFLKAELVQIQRSEQS